MSSCHVQWLDCCRRGVAESRNAVDNMAAAGSRRELEADHESEYCTTADDHRQQYHQWPELPMSYDDDWDVMTALIATEAP